MPLDKVDPVGRQPATQYVVETADAGRRTILSDISADIRVTRPTVYRYFATTDALFSAADEVALGRWTARIGELTAGMDDPAELLVEAVAYLIERLPEEPLLSLLLETDRMRLISRQMVMPDAIARSRIILELTSTGRNGIPRRRTR